MKSVRTILFGSYNICNGRNGGLEYVLRGMTQANMDPGVLQETKFTRGVFTQESVGYEIIAANVPIPHHSAVTNFYHEADHFALQALRLHSPKVVRFQQDLGGGQ